MSQPLEHFRGIGEGETPVASTVLVATLETLARISEVAGADERHTILLVSLLERGIAGTVRAEHVLDTPTVTARHRRDAQTRGCARSLAIAAGTLEHIRNFPQDSLRGES